MYINSYQVARKLVILGAWWDMGSNSDYKPVVRIVKRDMVLLCLE